MKAEKDLAEKVSKGLTSKLKKKSAVTTEPQPGIQELIAELATVK